MGWRLRAGVALLLAGGTLCTAGLAFAVVVQRDELRVTLLAQVLPYRLPRIGTAPIAVFVSGHVGTTNRSLPPQLTRMTIQVNRHGLLDDTGLPVCRRPEIAPASTQRALDNCADALVGSGRFWASIVLPGQRPYPSRGRLLVFNGRRGDEPVLFTHIYTKNPFSTSFVITFSRRRVQHGAFGTELTASLPQALGTWGFVDRIKLTLRRKYRYQGRERSFFNSGCPAPKQTRTAIFPLALAKFYFADERQISATVTKVCEVKE